MHPDDLPLPRGPGDAALTPDNESQEGVCRVTVEADLHDQFADTIGHWLHRQKAILHSVVINAARLAAAGVRDPAILPPARGHQTWRRPVRVKWQQCDSEYDRCRDLIEGAGSSVPEVIRAGMQAYVDAGGSLLDMVVTPRKRPTNRPPVA